MGQVGEEPGPEHLLIAPEREQLLERDEQEEQERDAEDRVAPNRERHHEGGDEHEAGDEAGTSVRPGRIVG